MKAKIGLFKIFKYLILTILLGPIVIVLSVFIIPVCSISALVTSDSFKEFKNKLVENIASFTGK